MKVCKICKEEKELKEFGKAKANKDGLNGQCKVCVAAYMKEYQQDNKEAITTYKKRNKKIIASYQKEYHQKNKKKLLTKMKEYNEKNKETIASYQKEYHQDYKPIHNARNKERRKTDVLFILKGRLRSRTLTAFKNKGYKKGTKTNEMLGAEWDIVKKHMERQFTKGMNWGNMSDWHIDHVIPLSSAKNEEELMNLSHYTNLQPLWVVDNLEKSDKIIEGTQNNLRL